MMDAERFDLVIRSLFAPRSRRTVLGLALGGVIAGLGLGDAEARKRRKNKRKERPSCSACADNEACVGRRCVSLARGCRAENDWCTTNEEVACGTTNDPEEEGVCMKTLGGNPICIRLRSHACYFCTSHDDCVRKGWGPRGRCLARGSCCGGFPTSSRVCALPYGAPCRAPDESCARDADCCSAHCAGGICRFPRGSCVGTQSPCDRSLECCGAADVCTGAPKVCCRETGSACTASSDCCGSLLCQNGTCGPPV